MGNANSSSSAPAGPRPLAPGSATPSRGTAAPNAHATSVTPVGVSSPPIQSHNDATNLSSSSSSSPSSSSPIHPQTPTASPSSPAYPLPVQRALQLPVSPVDRPQGTSPHYDPNADVRTLKPATPPSSRAASTLPFTVPLFTGLDPAPSPSVDPSAEDRLIPIARIDGRAVSELMELCHAHFEDDVIDALCEQRRLVKALDALDEDFASAVDSTVRMKEDMRALLAEVAHRQLRSHPPPSARIPLPLSSAVSHPFVAVVRRCAVVSVRTARLPAAADAGTCTPPSPRRIPCSENSFFAHRTT